MSDAPSGAQSEESPLDRAAAAGPLPGVEEQEAVEERGEDESFTADGDAKAERTGTGVIPGGIAMH